MELETTRKKLSSGEPFTLVALGDSLTCGWMVRRGYLDFLDEMLHRKYPAANFLIINKGIPGDTAEGGMMRAGHDVVPHKPDLVIIQFALNDAFSGCPVEVFKSNILSIIDRVKKNSPAEILLLTSVALGDDHENRMAERFYERLIHISEVADVALAQVHAYWQKKISEGTHLGSLVQADQVHPTEAGYRLMAEAVMEVL